MTETADRLPMAARALKRLDRSLSNGELAGLIQSAVTPRSEWATSRDIDFLVKAQHQGKATRSLVAHLEEVGFRLLHVNWGSSCTHLEFIDPAAAESNERPVLMIDLIPSPTIRGRRFRGRDLSDRFSGDPSADVDLLREVKWVTEGKLPWSPPMCEAEIRRLQDASELRLWILHPVRSVMRVVNAGVARLRRLSKPIGDLLLVTPDQRDEDQEDGIRSLEESLGLPRYHFSRARTRLHTWALRLRGSSVVRTHADLRLHPPAGIDYTIGFRSQELLLLVPRPRGWLRDPDS